MMSVTGGVISGRLCRTRIDWNSVILGTFKFCARVAWQTLDGRMSTDNTSQNVGGLEVLVPRNGSVALGAGGGVISGK